MEENVILIYRNTELQNHAFWVTCYQDYLSHCGYQVQAYNLSIIKYSREIWPSIKAASPTFVITFDLCGYEMLTVGEDSLLTLLSCPIYHIMQKEPYFFVSFLSTRFTCRMRLLVSDTDEKEFINHAFPDIPSVVVQQNPAVYLSTVIPYEQKEKQILFCRSLNQSTSLLQEIRNLPPAFSKLCTQLAELLLQPNHKSFYECATYILQQFGIPSLSAEETKELYPILHLAEKLSLAIQEDALYAQLASSPLPVLVTDSSWTEVEIHQTITHSRIIIDLQKGRYRNQACYHHCHYITMPLEDITLEAMLQTEPEDKTNDICTIEDCISYFLADSKTY